MLNDWFIEADGPDLEQGDLFFACPIVRAPDLAFPVPEVIDVNLEDHDVVVLSQDCDLENDKIEDVLLAQVQLYADLVEREGEANGTIKGRKWRASVRKGEQPAYVLIPYGLGSDAAYALVDFHHLYTVPKRYLVGIAATAGARPRLVSPYKEHLSQAFASFMMRVGLPNDLKDFENADPDAGQ